MPRGLPVGVKLKDMLRRLPVGVKLKDMLQGLPAGVKLIGWIANDSDDHSMRMQYNANAVQCAMHGCVLTGMQKGS